MTKLILTATALSLVAGMTFAQVGAPGAHMTEQWDGNADG